MKTFQPKGKIDRKRIEIDARGQILGRLATKIAGFLMGKGKASYSANIDSGDFVEVSNAKDIVLTGKKAKQKIYISHSGYPGGLKKVSFEKMNKEQPSKVVRIAVSGMLPDNRLKRDRMARLSFK
mgnify:CR=1 FL=1